MDCQKRVVTTKELSIRAAKKPGHFCTCGLRVQQRAEEHPRLFASGYDNEQEWKDEYGVSVPDN